MEPLEHVTRITILRIPVDIVAEEHLEEVIKSILKDENKNNQIVLLSFSMLRKARRNAEYRRCIQYARLVIPTSKSIYHAAKFLKKDIPVIYKPFTFIIKLLGILERNKKNVYLLGGKKNRISKAEYTLRSSFPKLQFIGRYGTNFAKGFESQIGTAITKLSPTLLLAGKGLKKRDLWLFRRRNKFSAQICLYDHDCFDVFSGKKKRPNYSPFPVLIKAFLKTLIMPWRFFMIFSWLWYVVLFITYRINKK